MRVARTRQQEKEDRNSMAIWYANALLNHCKDLEPYYREVAEKVLKKGWATQHQLETLEFAEKKHNPFGDEGIPCED